MQTQKVIFSELGVDGISPYQRGDWHKIAVHTPDEIRGFFGPYRFLSNAERCDVWYEGLKYPSSENAYQAAKFPSHERGAFQQCSPIEAIRLSATLPIADVVQWAERRVDVMRAVLMSKFEHNVELREKLLATGDAYLEERLWWRDTFWGFDVNLNQGENRLGQLLMEIRRDLRAQRSANQGELGHLTLPAHW